MLTTKELANKLNVGTSTVKRWVSSELLKNSSLTKHLKFKEEDVNTFLLENSNLVEKIQSRVNNIGLGDKFGRLTVVKVVSPSLIECICECGVEGKLVSPSRLKRGIIKRCSSNCSLDSGNSIANSIYREYQKEGRKSAKKQFFLTKEETYVLFKGNCYYCDTPPTRVRKVERLNGSEYCYNGIDRLDSTKNYTLDNVVSCCSKCNWMKHVLSVDEFKEHITLIYEKFISKK